MGDTHTRLSPLPSPPKAAAGRWDSPSHAVSPPAFGAPRAGGRRRCAKAGGTGRSGRAPWLGRAPGPDLGGDFCFCFPLVLLEVDSVHLGLSGRFGEREIYIYFFFRCCCYFISKRTTACIGAGRAEQGGVLRQGMPQHGGPSSLPAALAPLPDEGGQCTGAECEETRARLEG